MKKIAFFEVEKWEEELIYATLPKELVYISSAPLTTQTMEEALDVEILSVFIYSSLSQEILSNFPHLKLITTRSTGIDHIDTSYANERGILICNVPAYGRDTIAEHTFALILALTRKILPSVEQTRKGNFSLEGLKGFQLQGKTLGIIGAGNIGKRVIELALAFGMRCLVFTPHRDPILERDERIKYTTLADLLSCSDVISLHASLGKETMHIINRSNVVLIKKGAYLINTARGGLIETQAILEGLEKEILVGVGLDVLEEECFIREERELLSEKFLSLCNVKTQLLNHMLLTHPNVLITPHNAFNSNESLAHIVHTTLTTITYFLEGKPLNNAIK